MVEGSISEWVKCSCYCTRTCSRGSLGVLLANGCCSVDQFCEFVVQQECVLWMLQWLMLLEHGFSVIISMVEGSTEHTVRHIL